MSRSPVNHRAPERLWLAVLGLALLAALCLRTSASAQTAQNGQHRPEAITVVCDDNYPPYIFRNDNGQVQGLLVDMWAAWETATGVRVDLRAMDWGEALKTFGEGRADVIDTIFYNEQRAKLYDFTKPYANLDVPVFVHKTLGGISDVQSLRGFTVGVKAGDAVIDVLGRYGIHSVKQYGSYKDIIGAARTGDIRVFSIDAPPALYYLYKFNLEGEFRQAFVLYSGQFHRAVRKGDLALLRLVEEGFAEIPARQSQAIEEKWLGAPLASRYDLRRLFIVAGSVAAVALALAFFNLVLRRRVRAKTAELAATLARLSESEERFRTIFNSVSDLIFIHTWPDGRIVDVNQRTCEVFGYTRQEMLNLQVEATSAGTAPYDQAHAMALMRKAYEGTPQVAEWLAKNRDGRLFWIEVSIRRALVLGREHILVSCRDIDERKRAEQARQTSEHTLRSLFSSMTDVILILDAQGRYLEIAPTKTDRLYRPPAELLGRTVSEVFPPEQAGYFLGIIRQALESGTVVSVDYHMDIADRRVWFAGNVSPLGPDRVLWVARDITERKKGEEALLENRERLQLALDAANDGLWDWRLDTGEAYFSPRYYTMLGYEPGEFPANFESISKLVHPDDLDTIRHAVSHSLRDSETNAFEIRMRAKSGEWKWILTRSRVVDRAPGGEPTRLAGTHTDITERKRAEEALARKDALLKAMLRNLPFDFWARDQNGRVIMQSDESVRLWGDLLTDARNEERIDPQSRAAWDAANRRVLAGEVVSGDREFVVPGGELRAFHDIVAPIRDGETVLGILGVNIDITERKRAEEALREREAQLTAIIENQPGLVWLKDGESRFLAVNTKFAISCGKGSPLELVGKTDLDIWPRELADMYRQDDREVMRTGQPAIVEEPISDKGVERWFETFKMPVRDAQGGVIGTTGYALDITERKKAEEDLRENLTYLNCLERLDNAIRKSRDLEQMMGDTLDVVLEIMAVDRAWLLYPCDPDAPSWGVPMMRTLPDYADILRPDQAVPNSEASRDIFRACLGSEAPVHFGPGGDMPLSPELQENYSVQSQLLVALYPKLGKPWVFGLHQCSRARLWTARERMLFKAMGGRIQDALNSLLFLRDLRESEERYRSLFEKAVEGIFQTALDGTIIEVNPALAHFYGYDSPEQFRRELGTTSGLYVDLKDRERWRGLLLEHGQVSNFEVQLKRRDGGIVWSSSNARLVRDGAGTPLYFSGSVLDITERKQAELSLRESEERYRMLFEQSLDAIAIHEGQSPVFTWVNQAFCQLFGYGPEEVYAFSTEEIWALVHPDDRDRVRASLTDRMAGNVDEVRYSFRIVRKDGAVRWVDVSGRRMAHGGRPMNLSIYRDTTERMVYEQALTQARDAADAANRAKSEFLANMSHEIRTPLNGIVGMIQLLDSSPLGEEERRYAQAALQSSQRLTRLLGDILDLSRIEARKFVVERKPFVLADILESVETLFRLPAGQKGVELVLHLDPDIPKLLTGDEHRLRQVLFNLVGNAVKFTQSGTIEVEAMHLAVAPGAQPRVLFVIADTGVGIPLDMIDQSFQMFTQVEGSLSRRHQGAGLGLAIVRHLVGLMGGPGIDVSSVVGQGTTFSFVLPFGTPAQGAVEKAGRPGGQPEPQSIEGLRVLLVEDEEINQLALRTGLERRGLAVTCVSDGEAALAALQAEPFDCVLMDIQMPGMSGLEVTQAIRTRPEFAHLAGIPVIALTAFAMSGDRERFLAAGMDDYLAKPFSFEDLEALLGRIRARGQD